jgi:hypothetical protein
MVATADRPLPVKITGRIQARTTRQIPVFVLTRQD